MLHVDFHGSDPTMSFKTTSFPGFVTFDAYDGDDNYVTIYIKDLADAVSLQTAATDLVKKVADMLQDLSRQELERNLVKPKKVSELQGGYLSDSLNPQRHEHNEEYENSVPANSLHLDL